MKDETDWGNLTENDHAAAAIGSTGSNAGAIESSNWLRRLFMMMTRSTGIIRVVCPAALFSGTLVIGMLQSEAATTDQAMRWYRDARFEESRKGFEALLDQRPNDHRLAFNAGAAAYRQGDFDGAARHFERALDSTDLQLQQQAFYNLGVSQFRAGEAAKDPAQRRPQWEMARDNFAAATGLDPSDAAARSNLDRMMALLEQEPEQQPQPQENQKGDEGEEGQEKDESQKGDESGKGDQSGQQDPSQKGDESGDSSEEQSGEQSGKDQEGKSGKSGEDSKSGKEDGGMEQGGEKDGQDGQDGKEGSEGPKALNPGKEGGEDGEGGSASGESRTGMAEQEVPVRMTVQQAEQMLDEARGEEKALIWRPPSTGRESRTASGRRKTW